jgi:hypothetical protein
VAQAAYPGCQFEIASVYDDLASTYGTFPLVISFEVAEHLFDPRLFARTLFNLVEPGGTAIVSTPSHGYIKNLALALTGRLDNHFTACGKGGISNSSLSRRWVNCSLALVLIRFVSSASVAFRHLPNRWSLLLSVHYDAAALIANR